jgi:tetratricopeptide (TPR) repeat protein
MKARLFLFLLSVAAAPVFGQSPETEESLYIKGVNFFIQRNYREAAAAWQQVITLDPGNTRAREYMEKAFDRHDAMETFFFTGLRYFNDNDMTNAVRDFQETLLINPNHEKAMYYLQLAFRSLSAKEQENAVEETESQALLLLQNNEFRRAVALYKTLVMLDPENDPFRLRLAEAERNLQVIDRSEELRLHIETAQDFSSREKYAEALSEWSRALVLDPSNATALEGKAKDEENLRKKEQLDKANAFFAQGVDDFVNKRYPQAKVNFQRVLQIDPENKAAQEYLRKTEEAMKALAAEQTAKDESNRYLFQGIRSYTNEEYDRALEEFETALTVFDKNPDAPVWIEKTKKRIEERERLRREQNAAAVEKLLEEATTRYELQQYSDSRTAFLKVRELDPENQIAAQYLRLLEERIRLEEQSVVSPDSPYFDLYSKYLAAGTAAWNDGRYKESLSWFEEILKLFPLNNEAGRYKLRLLNRLDPDRYQALLNERLTTGRKHLDQGRFNEARREFQAVKDIVSDYPGIDDLIAQTVPQSKADVKEIEKHYLMGEKNYSENSNDEAIREWEQALALDPSPDTNPFFAKASLGLNKARKRVQLASGNTGPAPVQAALTDKEKAVKRHLALAQGYYFEGKLDLAIEEWQNVLKLDRSNAQALQFIERAKKKQAYSQR